MTTTATRASQQDLSDLGSAVTAYCRARLPEPTRARPGQLRDAAAVRQLWTAMSAELGLGALLVDEEHGGAGATLVAAGRVAESLGGELAPVPFLSAGVLAPTLLAQAAGDASTALLRSVAQDGLVVAVALSADEQGGLQPGPVVRADGLASASFSHVLDADVADVLVLVGDRGRQLAAVRVDDVMLTPRPAFDLTRGLADVVATAAPATVLAEGDVAGAAVQATLVAGRLALAAESAGGAQAALSEAVSYARQRVQFGREIGSFQAIKHLLADRYLDAEAALSVARLALQAQVDAAPDAEELYLLAATYCAQKYAAVAADGIQVHGGVGFTAEYRAHLHLRRAQSHRYLLGDPAALRTAYLDAVIRRSS